MHEDKGHYDTVIRKIYIELGTAIKLLIQQGTTLIKIGLWDVKICKLQKDKVMIRNFKFHGPITLKKKCYVEI